MRPKLSTQLQFVFQPSHLRVTNAYYKKYAKISRILDDNPQLVDLIHADIQEPVHSEVDPTSGQAHYRCSSETVLRLMITQLIERLSLRDSIVRVDDSEMLRQFTRIYNDPMVDFTTFCRLRGRVTAETMHALNQHLAHWALECGRIGGSKLRIDTTAVETNIHWPTDSSLLWDTYRTLARLMRKLRPLAERVVGDRRLQVRKAKRLYTRISRVARTQNNAQQMNGLYFQMIQLLGKLMRWCSDVIDALQKKRSLQEAVRRIQERMEHFLVLGERVVRQAWLRTIEGKSVPNDQKLFSIFEPHTELLKRGKTVRNIEFGHMIEVRQVENRFITGYTVFDKKPSEPELIDAAVQEHLDLFGSPPDVLTADKGYFDSARIAKMRLKVKMVAVAKKGKRSEEEKQREHDPSFRRAQRFRAGIEGTISFLKRVLGLARCYCKGFPRYAATVGATILAHNLLILARR